MIFIRRGRWWKMYKEPKAMKEIHSIREQMYEEHKGLSDKKVIERIHKKAEEVKRKYKLKLRSRSDK